MKVTGANESAEEIEARPDALFLLGPGSSPRAQHR
jgi:hypothetical protein